MCNPDRESPEEPLNDCYWQYLISVCMVVGARLEWIQWKEWDKSWIYFSSDHFPENTTKPYVSAYFQ